jgi:DNA-binding NarL/FixJ family response regulator
MNRITVLVVEDHTIVREGLRRMLELDAELRVVGEAQDGRQAVALAMKLRPDVVLMDIAMPLLNGFEATRQVLKAVPGMRVVILSAHSDDAYVKNATAAGAVGFLVKQSSYHEVGEAIRAVHQGRTFFNLPISRRFVRADLRSSGTAAEAEGRHLTSREMEVLQLIAEGKANKETAVELKISVKTVEKHRGHLMEKLDIHDIAGLTRYAIGAGIIESSVQVTII